MHDKKIEGRAAFFPLDCFCRQASHSGKGYNDEGNLLLEPRGNVITGGKKKKALR